MSETPTRMTDTPEPPVPDWTAPGTAQRLRHGGLPRVLRLARKELRETLRDRRTIGTLILMPLILYPLLSIVFQRFLVTTLLAPESTVYRVGVEDAAGMEIVRQWVVRGDVLLQQAADEREQPRVDHPSFNALTPAVSPKVEWFTSPDPGEEVQRMRLDLAIVLDRPPGDTEVSAETEMIPAGLRLRMIYRDQSLLSQGALLFVEQRLRAHVEEVLRARGDPRIPQFSIRHQRVVAEGAGGLSLAALVPLILVLTTITGAVYPAIDLTAGERERGTLETLIAAPVPRLSLLLAKYVAVVTVAVLTASVNMVAMTITLRAAGLTTLLFGPAGLPISAMAIVFLLLILFACFFSAVLLALTSFARSFKEAQAYLIPLMLVAIAPGLLSLIPAVELDGPLMIAPLVNMVLLARDVLQESARPLPATVAVLSTLFYAFAAIALAARSFGADAVLYGTQQSWGEWLQRPRTARPRPTITSALACLALLFPAYVVTAGLLAQWQAASPAQRLMASGAATLLLFGGLPLVWMAWGRVRLRSGFQLRPASPLTFFAAVVLGLSAWVLAHQIVVLSEQFRVEGIVARQQGQIEAMLAAWRLIPPWMIVLTLAIAPAVGEELYFRGYLLGALRDRWRPWQAIVASAVLFGLFHLITTQMLAVERFATSAAMGLLLGWICHRTASVLPGMLLHAINNGLLLLAAYYRDELRQRGWQWLDDQALPTTWVIAAVGAVGVGLIVVACSPASDPSEREEEG